MFDTAKLEPPYDPTKIFKLPILEVTQSAFTTYNICPQRYAFRYLMQIVPMAVSLPLVIGRAFHAAMEYLLSPANKKDPPTVRHHRCMELIDRVFDKTVEGTEPGWMVNSDKLEHGRAQATAMVRAWQVVYDVSDMFKLLATEFKIRAKKGATHSSPIEDRGAGKIDGLVEELIQHLVLILEHKSRFSLKDLDFVQGIPLDHQSLWYVLLLGAFLKRPENKGKFKHIKKAPSGFMYDVVAKPQHRSADNFEHLVQRMYEAMIEKQENYFSMTPVEVDEEMLSHARSNFVKLVDKMDNLSPKTLVMRTHSCNMYGGCPYRPLCSAGADAGKPESVLALPQMEMYRFQGLHNELEEDDAIVE